jgi:hypothetical protein
MAHSGGPVRVAQQSHGGVKALLSPGGQDPLLWFVVFAIPGRLGPTSSWLDGRQPALCADSGHPKPWIPGDEVVVQTDSGVLARPGTRDRRTEPSDLARDGVTLMHSNTE